MCCFLHKPSFWDNPSATGDRAAVLTRQNCSSFALLFNPSMFLPCERVRRFKNKPVDVVTFLKVCCSFGQLFLIEVGLDKCDLYISELGVQVFLIYLSSKGEANQLYKMYNI